MARAPISDYALIGNLRCAALVSKTGSVDWYCPVKFDAPACFAALLGDERHGCWRIAPAVDNFTAQRSYLDETLVLETRYETDTGAISITDFMPLTGCTLVRIVRGLRGRVEARSECVPRFNYGYRRPAIEVNEAVIFRCGDEQLTLRSNVERAGEAADEDRHCFSFTVAAGEQHWFTLAHSHCEDGDPRAINPFEHQAHCAKWWRRWSARCNYSGRWRTAVMRSLITLKALTYEPSGGMVAAPTTSLPEFPGGSANWDYRFCWVRDATLALEMLLGCNYRKEADAWRKWLEHAVGDHDKPLQTLYTIEGETPPREQTVDWLPGYGGARPVHIGNAASRQFQMDLRGELMDVLHMARESGLDVKPEIWQLQCRALDYLGDHWREPDAGFWEFRGEYRQLTHSKVMTWVAFDRSIRDAERYELSAPVDRWRAMREEIRRDVLCHGVDSTRGCFTQRYGAPDVDASLLMIPLVGFLPATDERMIRTVTAIEQELLHNGLVYRYKPDGDASRFGDGAGEGAFLLCSFWLADNYFLAGRYQDAEDLLESLLALSNDVGLLAEEYDPVKKRFLGNFPQSLTHLALINSARLIGSSDRVRRSG